MVRVGNSDSPSDHDLASLQWARAIAAMAVVVYHCGQVIEIRTGLMVTHITDFGAAGVDVFFVVSGLIMTLTTRRSNPFLVGDFLVRRAIRLVPIYWFYTLLKSVALLAVPGAALFSHFSVTHLLSSLFFIPFAVDGRGIFPVILVGWTLNCEVLFYLLFAASKALLPSRAMLLLSLVLVALAASHFIVGTGSAMLTFWTNPILLEFALGVGAAELYLVEVRLSAPASALLVLLGTGALVAIPEMPIWRPLLWSVPAVALVFGMLSAERFVPSRRVRAMVSIDNRSYSLYLTHTLAIAVLAALALRLPGPNAIGAAWALLPMMGAAVVIGWLAYILLERPVFRRLQAAWRGWRTDILADLVPIT